MKKFSGKFVIRIPPKLHEDLVYQSQKSGISLNQFCLSLLIHPSPSPTDNHSALWARIRQDVLPPLQKHFGNSLLAVLVFGSYVTGHATEASDLDLLIVLSTHSPITSKNYRWWEAEMRWPLDTPVLSPHFVHIPAQATKASSLWLEVAENYHMIYNRGSPVTHSIQEILSLIQQGTVRKYWSNGHPYWVWRNHEK